MTRRNLRIQIFKLLFRVEFNSPEDMPEQVRLFFDADESADPEAQEEIQKNDNSENSADSDFDENEDFVDDDFLEM